MNDDPIKENNPFRMGLDNLTGDDDINSGIEYSDLHNCSNDLSDRGSRREEIAHAKFAEQQRRNQYKNTYYANRQNNKKVVIAKNPGNIVVGIFVLYIAIQVIAAIGTGIYGTIQMFETASNSSNYIPENIYNNEIYYDDDADYTYNDTSLNTPYATIPNYTPEVEITKKNINIKAGLSEFGNTLIVQIENKNSLAMYNTITQIIFYDEEDKPIEVYDVSLYELPANKVETQEVFNLPKYSRFDIYMPDRYDEDIPYSYKY